MRLESEREAYCGLLVRAASNRDGRFVPPVETDTAPEVSEVVAFPVEGARLEKEGGDGMWTATPAGRFWFER